MILFFMGLVSFGTILMFAVPPEVRVVFLNVHAISIVLLGTLAAGWLSIRADMWVAVIQFSMRSIFTDFRKERASLPNLLLALERDRGAILDAPHPMIKYAQSLWRKGIEPEQFEALLTAYAETRLRDCEGAAVALQSLAKYPPSLGMIGTVISLVGLFSQLGASGIKGVLGPSLALAMTATFYGLSLANWILLPLSDRLAALQSSETALLTDLRQWILYIHRGYPLAVSLNQNVKKGASLNAA